MDCKLQSTICIIVLQGNISALTAIWRRIFKASCMIAKLWNATAILSSIAAQRAKCSFTGWGWKTASGFGSSWRSWWKPSANGMRNNGIILISEWLCGCSVVEIGRWYDKENNYTERLKWDRIVQWLMPYYSRTDERQVKIFWKNWTDAIGVLLVQISTSSNGQFFGVEYYFWITLL